MDWNLAWWPLICATPVLGMYVTGFLFPLRATRLDLTLLAAAGLIPCALLATGVAFESNLHRVHPRTPTETVVEGFCIALSAVQIGVLAVLVFRAYRDREWSVVDGIRLLGFLALAGVEALLTLGLLVLAGASIEGTSL